MLQTNHVHGRRRRVIFPERRLRGWRPCSPRGKDQKGAGPSLALPSPRHRSGQWASSTNDGRTRLCSNTGRVILPGAGYCRPSGWPWRRWRTGCVLISRWSRMPAQRRRATSSKLKAASRNLLAAGLRLSIYIAQRPSPVLSGPPLAGTLAAVDHRHWGEAGSGGSGPLHSAAGAKGEPEGETAPLGVPLVGRRAKPARDDSRYGCAKSVESEH